MADYRDRDRDTTGRHYPYQQAGYKGSTLGYRGGAGGGSGGGPSASQVIAVITLLPVSGTLLILAGLALAGSIIGLIVTTPLFILFSPVLVPAALLIGLAVTGFLSSGAFGLTGLSALSRVVAYLRQAAQSMPEDLDYAKRRAADAGAYAGQKTKEAGQTIEGKPRETGTTRT